MKGREGQLWVLLPCPGLHLQPSRTWRGGEAAGSTLLERFSSEWGEAGNSLTQPSCVLGEGGRCGEVPRHPASGSPALGLRPDCHASPPRGASASWARAWAGRGFTVTHAAQASGRCRGTAGSGRSPERARSEGSRHAGAGSPFAEESRFSTK